MHLGLCTALEMTLLLRPEDMAELTRNVRAAELENATGSIP